MTTFYIVGFDSAVNGVWRGYGCEQVRDMKDADIVILTGGADINPAIYGAQNHKSMYFSRNTRRDDEEIEAYWNAQALGKNIFGICRGAQLAHCLNGGTLWQDVSNHASRGHNILDHKTGKKHFVSSCHHQMMRVDNHPRAHEFEVVATASGVSNRRETYNEVLRASEGYFDNDIEVLWYPLAKTICYQSHPEFGVRTDTMYAYELQKRFGFFKEDKPDIAPEPIEPEPFSWDVFLNMNIDERLRARMHAH